MVVILVMLFRAFLTSQMVDKARTQADKGIRGSMEGHAEMDMSVRGGPIIKRIFSQEGRTAISHYFVMDWVAIRKDTAGWFAPCRCARRLGTEGFLERIFPELSSGLGEILGADCRSIGRDRVFCLLRWNVPLAAVLWNGGISFGGVIAFIFADLIVLPVLDIYRMYYGWKMMWFILGTFYTAMVGGALVIEFLFSAAGWIPQQRSAQIVEAAITLNYTTILNLIFLVLAALLLSRFFLTGGRQMIRHMK
jgi:hypothetical protein